MVRKRPIAVDLFAGAGGLSLGLEQAGFDVVAAVEIDPIHACVHEYNFPRCKVIARSVTDIDGKYIRSVCGLSANEKIDVVAGGAPCQGFSLIGQRALDDPRNLLVKEYIRLVRELEPSYFIFENVKGLTIGKHKKFLKEIIAELEACGYKVVQPWKILNAKDYAVPQSRERLFLLGAREGKVLPSYPEKSSGSFTCSDALDDLPDAEGFDELLDSDEVDFQYTKRADGYSALMRCSTEAAWKFGYKRRWDCRRLTCSLRTGHTDLSRRRFKETKPGTVEKTSRFFKLSKDGISNTLRAGTDSARGAFTSPRPIHYKYDRCVTVREMARLHGFPDWFRLHKTKWHGARQIGNSVPPPLAYAIGTALLTALSLNLVKPTEILDLGELSLLKMDMSSASRYWGIAIPIAQRERKNVYQNRQQLEINYPQIERKYTNA
ncbi:MAG: DNA cytosine methyltransferase [bacterium]|nr:DNA cytosine methyltransferase [bacterium]